MINFLLKFQVWKDRQVEYGFYLRRSYFSWGEKIDPRGQGLRLMFAWGNKDFTIKYL